MSVKKNSNKMWGGRFSNSPDQLMQQINQSISFDKRLYKQDISGSIAHCKMLAKVKIISSKERDLIISGLQKILEEINNNEFNFSIELEDIHLNIESRLKEIIGDVAGKLHTARSRNDQVALDFRLFVRDNIHEIQNLLLELQENLVQKSAKNIEVIMPGFTHLQLAQPVLFSHHLLAYYEMFKRDMSRLQDLAQRLDECPLGACALAGTSYPIDRDFVAKELGFAKPTANSMDSVSDRDFAIEFLFCLNLIANHLSRLSEEIIIWMSRGFGFIKLSDRFTSGSSIMPQKKNPDGAELIRGKTGRITGALVSLLTTMKALTLTYSKDMQEDKEPLFDALENSKICIKLMALMIEDMAINKENMLKMASMDYSCATDLADWLVQKLNLPFRQCHHLTGAIVKMAEEKNLDLHQLKLSDMQKIEPRITKEIFNFLDVKNSVKSRNSYGGTSPSQVKLQIETAKKYLKSFKK
ncbi:MAG: argininosuccinate lyase [Alphaproteobacteria bacterium]